MYKTIKKVLILFLLGYSVPSYSVEYSIYGYDKSSNLVPSIHYHNAKEDNFGTVILAHGCSGVTGHENHIAKFFANEGFHAVVVDSYAYRGLPTGHQPKFCVNNPVSRDDRLEEIYKTVEWIKQQDWHQGKIFLVGFSHGGMAAIAASKKRYKGIDKAVAFYPYCYSWDHGEPYIPIQVHTGELDDWTPASLCRGMYDGFFRKFDKGQLFEYKGAYHGFDIRGVDLKQKGVGHLFSVGLRTIRFNEEAFTLSYTRMLEFFRN